MKPLRIVLIVLSIMLLSISLFGQERTPERIARETLVEGETFFEARDYPNAIEKFVTALNSFRELETDIIKYDAEIKDTLYKLWASGTNARNFEVAIQYGREYLVYDPSNDSIVRSLAQVYRVGMNDIQSAIQLWKDFDDMFDSFVAKQEIADLYARIEDAPNAIIWYNQALEMNSDADLLQKLASQYISANQPERAIAIYENFIESGPSRRQLGIALRNMGRLYQDLNNIPMAIQKYETFLENEYDRSITLWLLSTYFDNTDFNLSNAKIDILLERNANDNDALYFRALILHANGDLVGARAIFQRLVSHPTYGQSAQGFIRSIDTADN